MRIPETGDYYRFKEAVLALPFSKADELVVSENGMVLHDGTVALEWVPLRAGTLRGWIETGAAWEDGIDVIKRVGGRVFVYDDGYGNLIVDGQIVGTIAYTSGAMHFPASAYRHSEYLVDYYYDSEHKIVLQFDDRSIQVNFKVTQAVLRPPSPF